MNYQTLTTQLTVAPNGGPIYDEGVTHVSIDDEIAGPFLVLTQHPDAGAQALRFDFEEWDHIDRAVRRLIAEHDGERDEVAAICEDEYKDMLAAKSEGRLPDPPEGRQWHCTDWTEGMLPEGYRPLLHGETAEPGDEIQWFGVWNPLKESWGKTYELSIPTRTTRPLPTT